MINNSVTRPRGFSRQTLRFCGILMLALGIAGQAIIQNAILGLNSMNSEELLEALDNQKTMGLATISILIMVIQSCAIPIFCFMLLEGFMRTSSRKKYFLRVLGVAVLSELPFNLAMSGKVFDLSTRNPVFGLVLCLAILYLYNHYAEKGAKNFFIKLLVSVMALFWVEMLNIVDGAACVLVVGTLWMLRNRRQYQILAGCVAMFAASIFSPFYLAAPMSFLAIHFYNGEPGEGNKYVNYLVYPVLLLVIGLIGKFAF